MTNTAETFTTWHVVSIDGNAGPFRTEADAIEWVKQTPFSRTDLYMTCLDDVTQAEIDALGGWEPMP